MIDDILIVSEILVAANVVKYKLKLDVLDTMLDVGVAVALTALS